MAISYDELYEQDFDAWTKQQVRALRRLRDSRPNEPMIDWPHLIEEVKDLGLSERSAVRSQTRRIIEHSLKLEFSPARDPRRGWFDAIVEARDVLRDKLTRTLRRDLVANFGRLYAQARGNAARRLRFYGEHAAADALPETSPYTLAQILDEDWFPENRHGIQGIG